jgi:hypothetical protein
MSSQQRARGKDMRKLFKSLQSHGLTIQCNKAHWLIYDANGTYLVSTSGTPKDEHNACRQIVRSLRRYHGIEIEM